MSVALHEPATQEDIDNGATAQELFKLLGSPSTTPDSFKLIIADKMPKIKGKTERINTVYLMFVKYNIVGYSYDGAAFLIAMQQAKDLFAEGKHAKCTAKLRSIYDIYIQPTDPYSPWKNNLAGPARMDAFPTEHDPNKGVWLRAEESIRLLLRKDVWGRFYADNEADMKWIEANKKERAALAAFRGAVVTKNAVVSVAKGAGRGICKGLRAIGRGLKALVPSVLKKGDGTVSAHVYTNELLGDNSELGYFREPARGYIDQDYSVSSGGYIDHGTGVVYGHAYIDPNIFVVLLCIFAVMCCVCVAFTSVISCVIGYFAHLFKDECVSVKRRIEEDEEV